MAVDTKKKFKLPEGEYTLGQLMVISMAGYLELLQPEELTFWFENGKTNSFIAITLWERIKIKRNVRNSI